MRRLEFNAQCEENRVQHQMMQMIMASIVTSNNPNLNIGQNIQDNTATRIGKSVELHEVNHDVNTAGTCNTDKDDKDIG